MTTCWYVFKCSCPEWPSHRAASATGTPLKCHRDALRWDAQQECLSGLHARREHLRGCEPDVEQPLTKANCVELDCAERVLSSSVASGA